jgi:hypothetical protein
MIPPDYEKRIGHAFQQALILCLCALLPPLFSLTGFFRPEDEPLGLWFQRSGIVMTVLAVLAHFKAAGIATTMIAGGTFAETWEAFHKYHRFQTLAAWLSLILIVTGTVIWAYGDLLFPEPPDDSEEQTAASALVGRFSTASLRFPCITWICNRNPDKSATYKDFRDLSSHTPAKGATDGKQQLAAVAHPARKTMKATVRCECDATRCRAPSVSFGQPRKLKVSGFLKPCRLRLAGIIECRA